LADDEAQRAIEARTRIVPLDDGRPEFRLLMTRQDGTLDILWSQVLTDGRDVNELAQMKMPEIKVRGWQVDIRQREMPS
jgi:hypothetical protein